MVHSVLKRRINKGVEWLNKTKPGWLSLIDLKILQMTDASVCICGQLFGGFWKAIGQVENGEGKVLSEREAILRGFYLEDDRNDCYDLLTMFWIRKIKQLRGEIV